MATAKKQTIKLNEPDTIEKIVADSSIPGTDQVEIDARAMRLEAQKYAECKNKSQLAVKLWELNEDLSAKEIVELAAVVRPDIQGFALSDANNGKVKWRQSQGIQGRTRTSTRVPGTTSISEASVWESAFFFVEQCGSIESAIAMLARLQNLKDIL